jgi:hypothetical protein
MYKS